MSIIIYYLHVFAELKPIHNFGQQPSWERCSFPTASWYFLESHKTMVRLPVFFAALRLVTMINVPKHPQTHGGNPQNDGSVWFSITKPAFVCCRCTPSCHWPYFQANFSIIALILRFRTCWKPIRACRCSLM